MSYYSSFGAHSNLSVIFWLQTIYFSFKIFQCRRKKNFMHFQSFWNFWFLTTRGILAFFTLCDSFRKFDRIEEVSESSKKLFLEVSWGETVRAKNVFSVNFKFFSLIFSKSSKIFAFSLCFLNSARSKTYPRVRSGSRKSFFLKSILDHFQWISRNRTCRVPSDTLSQIRNKK